MKLNVLALALAATAFGSLAANAQTTTTTVIEERRAPPAAVIIEPAPTTSVTVEKDNAGLLGNQKRTTVETTGADGTNCRTRTTETNTLLGSSSSTREHCN